MKKFIYSWNPNSNSAKILSTELGVQRIKHKESNYHPSKKKIILNWGCSHLPGFLHTNAGTCRCINSPIRVAIASNKLLCLRHLQEDGVSIPRFTEDRGVAQKLLDGGKPIVVRHVLTGNSGEGIELLEAGIPAVVPKAPLYTVYLGKIDEYRVHVMNDEVLSVQRKARNLNVPDEDINWKIRNTTGGFIFARNEGKDIPNRVEEVALNAMDSLALDFGAVDVIWNRNGAFVLEVNTAPGLTGTTIEDYVDGFKRHFP